MSHWRMQNVAWRHVIGEHCFDRVACVFTCSLHLLMKITFRYTYILLPYWEYGMRCFTFSQRRWQWPNVIGSERESESKRARVGGLLAFKEIECLFGTNYCCTGSLVAQRGATRGPIDATWAIQERVKT